MTDATFLFPWHREFMRYMPCSEVKPTCNQWWRLKHYLAICYLGYMYILPEAASTVSSISVSTNTAASFPLSHNSSHDAVSTIPVIVLPMLPYTCNLVSHAVSTPAPLLPMLHYTCIPLSHTVATPATFPPMLSSTPVVHRHMFPSTPATLLPALHTWRHLVRYIVDT